MNLKTFLFVLSTILISTSQAQIGRLPLSPVQRIEQNIGLTTINIEYSRPSARGRTIFGELVPYGELWRTGANRNTTIEINQEFIFGNARIDAGKYAIFTRPNEQNWEVILYSKTDNWNVPDELDKNSIVATIEASPNKIAPHLEVFSITIDDFTNEEFSLTIAWENTSVSIPIGMVNLELMDAQIEQTLGEPSYDDYYAAASHQMESGKDYAEGLKYINKAIEITDEVTWWDLRIKAKLLINLGRKKEALTIAERGLGMAKKEGREYGIREFNIILDALK